MGSSYVLVFVFVLQVWPSFATRTLYPVVLPFPITSPPFCCLQHHFPPAFSPLFPENLPTSQIYRHLSSSFYFFLAQVWEFRFLIWRYHLCLVDQIQELQSMDQVLGHKPATRPPVVIESGESSMSCDPEPSAPSPTSLSPFLLIFLQKLPYFS